MNMDKITQTAETIIKELQLRNKVMRQKKRILERIISELNKPIPTTESKIQAIARIERVIGFLSYMVSYKLEDCIEKRDWFFGILLSASVLEDLGKRKLQIIFADEIKPTKIDRLTLEETIMLLFASKAIDDKVYTQLLEIKKARNGLAHNPIESLGISLETDSTRDKAKHAKSIIKKAIYCLKAICPPIIP